MNRIIEKVTAFVTRRTEQGTDLLLFEHPYAGIHIPAGTVEAGETPRQAVLREAAEETGLARLSVHCYGGSVEDQLPDGQRIVLAPTKVFARPDLESFDWAYLRPGIEVAVDRQAAGFAQVTYEEPDRVPDPQYVTMRITGWVPDGVLTDTRRRHFFHLEFTGTSPARWTVRSDNHLFTLFWAPLADLPPIIPPQDAWLAVLAREFEEVCRPNANKGGESW